MRLIQSMAIGIGEIFRIDIFEESRYVIN